MTIPNITVCNPSPYDDPDCAVILTVDDVAYSLTDREAAWLSSAVYSLARPSTRELIHAECDATDLEHADANDLAYFGRALENPFV